MWFGLIWWQGAVFYVWNIRPFWTEAGVVFLNCCYENFLLFFFSAQAALIMQVLQLTADQIAMLPPEQRQSILILKEQIQKSTGAPWKVSRPTPPEWNKLHVYLGYVLSTSANKTVLISRLWGLHSLARLFTLQSLSPIRIVEGYREFVALVVIFFNFSFLVAKVIYNQFNKIIENKKVKSSG